MCEVINGIRDFAGPDRKQNDTFDDAIDTGPDRG